MAKRDIDVRDPLPVPTQAREIRCGTDLARQMLVLERMRLALAAAALLLTTTAARAQPGASSPDPSYGPPPPPPQPAPHAPPQPPPTYEAPPPQPQPQPQPYPQPQPQPYPHQQPQPYPQPQPYGHPQPQPYGHPQPQPYGQPYPQQQQPYGQPNPGAQPYGQNPGGPPYGQPYPGAPQYAPRPYYSAQPYAQAPVTALTRPAPLRELKKPGTAQLLAVGATGLGFLAVFAGAEDNNEELALAGAALTLIGPSAGHIYAGENGHAVKMSLLRTGALLTFVYGAVKSTEGDCIDYCYENDNTEGEAAMYLGGAVFVIGTLYDLYDSGRAARRFNEKAAKLTLGPTVMSSAKGGTSPGVALSGSF